MAYRLYKRGPVWWVRINGRRVSTRQSSREAADAVARDLERRDADPAYAAAHEATLAGAVTALLGELARRERRPATIGIVRQKAGHLVRLLPPQLASIDARAVDAYVAAREAEGAAPLTITKELSALRQALRLALRRGEFSRPLEAVMPIGYSPRYVPRSRWLTPEELDALVAQLAEGRAAHVLFLVATSARWSESVAARREDVDAAAWTVLLRGTKTARARRTVPIAPPFRPLLEQALRWARPAGALFERWTHVGRDVKAACARAGIPSCTPNDLRRTHATWLRNAGVEPHLIAPVLGHTTSKMVETVYGRVDVRELGARLEERVPRVYRAHGSDGPDGVPDTLQTAAKAAPPGRVELPANGLGRRGSSEPRPWKTAGDLEALRERVPLLYRAAAGLEALLETDPDAWALALASDDEM